MNIEATKTNCLRQIRMVEEARASADAMRDTANRNVSKALREARMNAGVTLRGLSKKLGFSFTYINEIEVGNRTPSRDYVVNFFEALRLLKTKTKKR